MPEKQLIEIKPVNGLARMKSKLGVKITTHVVGVDVQRTTQVKWI